MQFDNRSSFWVIGMALFAMFFGSGNLIYPLYIGTQAHDAWLSSTLGFLITAVFLPFLGVIAMVLYRGNYDNFFKVIGQRKGFLLCILLLTVWIPLGSAPRCMTLAYASLNSYFSHMPPLWIFSLLYSLVVFVVITRKVGVLDLLGKFITPLLLGCIALITYQGFVSLPQVEFVQKFDVSVFWNGLVEGYNTMDLIASFFFSASVIHIIHSAGSHMREALSLVFKSSIVGMMLLGIVYVCQIGLSAHYYMEVEGVAKDQILAYLAQHILGGNWSFVAILAIFLACFSTSIALIIAYTDFLHEEIFEAKRHPYVSMLFALSLTFVVSLFGLEGITLITTPALKICYPLLLGLIIWNVTLYLWKKKENNKELA